MDKPNPGSRVARGAGCTCPIIDNNHGLHPPWPDAWWVRGNCPIHGTGDGGSAVTVMDRRSNDE